MLQNIKKETILGVLLLAAFLVLSTQGVRQAVSGQTKKKEKIIVIDPGHGGEDPGKIGINGALEKDINLEISKKLQKCFRQQGLDTVMTREKDEGLCRKQSGCKKQEDMRNRCAKIDEANPLFTVSVHQNSYPQEAVCGPQVFYFSQSKEGEIIAAYIQEALNTCLEMERPRQHKGNNTYYLLKKTKTPTIIVECGFLSNYKEAKMLTEESYQKKVAEAIGAGVKAYLDSLIDKKNLHGLCQYEGGSANNCGT